MKKGKCCNYKRHIFLDYICHILLSNEMDGFDSNEKIRFSNDYKYTVWIAEGAVWSFAFVVGGPYFYIITRTILAPLKAKLLHIFILFAEKFLAITVFETWFCRYFLFPGDLIYSMKSVSIPQLQFSFWLFFMILITLLIMFRNIKRSVLLVTRKARYMQRYVMIFLMSISKKLLEIKKWFSNWNFF